MLTVVNLLIKSPLCRVSHPETDVLYKNTLAFLSLQVLDTASLMQGNAV